jgi:hypothetical protein
MAILPNPLHGQKMPVPGTTDKPFRLFFVVSSEGNSAKDNPMTDR